MLDTFLAGRQAGGLVGQGTGVPAIPDPFVELYISRAMTNHQASQGHPFLFRPDKHTSLSSGSCKKERKEEKSGVMSPSGMAKGWLSAGVPSVRLLTDFIFSHVLAMTTAQETH